MAIICAWLLSLGPELFLLPVACYSLFDFVHSSPRCITPSRHPNTNESQRGNTRKAVVKEGGFSPRHSSRGCVVVGSLIVPSANWEKGLFSGGDSGKQRTKSYGILGLGGFLNYSEASYWLQTQDTN